MAIDNKLTWQQKTGEYQNGFKGLAGKWHCFSVDWSTQSKNYEGPQWALTCRLPGLKEDLGLFATVELAYEKAERTLRYWLANLENTFEKAQN